MPAWLSSQWRRRISATTLLVVTAASSACGSDDSRSGGAAQNSDAHARTSPAGASLTTVRQVSGDPTPSYKTVALARRRRFDQKNTYYIVIDPVDLTNDHFKHGVKLVLQAVAKSAGGPDFSANIYDNEPLATAANNQDNGTGDLDANDIRAQRAKEELHLVAMYDGGLTRDAQVSNAPDAYNILWFPGADRGTAGVGEYVGNEQWAPAI